MPPRPDFIFSDKPCVDQVIAFDASSTEDDPQDTLSYRWDFGDGATAEGQKATKAYTKGGTHKVTLIVDDNVGTKCSVATLQKQITVNSPPIADAGSDIEMCVKSGEELVVNFDGSGSSDPDADELAYYWDFGDGENATGQFAEHTYKKGGAYTVKLLVDDGVGSQCSSDSDTITARLNTQPVADAGPNLVCCLGQEAVFDGSGSYDADGDMLSYHWDFGDGTTAEGQKATHAYLKRGAYTVTLKVDDNAGTACSVSTTSFKAVVNESPVAIIKVSE
jgi:PKD repeat protein